MVKFHFNHLSSERISFNSKASAQVAAAWLLATHDGSVLLLADDVPWVDDIYLEGGWGWGKLFGGLKDFSVRSEGGVVVQFDGFWTQGGPGVSTKDPKGHPWKRCRMGKWMKMVIFQERPLSRGSVSLKKILVCMIGISICRYVYTHMYIFIFINIHTYVVML